MLIQVAVEYWWLQIASRNVNFVKSFPNYDLIESKYKNLFYSVENLYIFFITLLASIFLCFDILYFIGS